MSEVLKRLKQAELERERVIAERRRLELEADAGLAAQEREDAARRAQAAAAVEAPPLPPAVHTRAVREASARRSWGGLAAAVAVACAFWLGMRMPQSPPAPAPRAAAPAPPALFRLERDSDAFAARVAATERR